MTCPLQPKSKRTSADALPNPLSNYFRLNFLMRFHTLLQSPNLLISSECSVSLSKPNCQIWACLPSSAHKISELLLYLWHSANNRKLLAFFFLPKWDENRCYLIDGSNFCKFLGPTCINIKTPLKPLWIELVHWSFSCWRIVLYKILDEPSRCGC